MQPTTVAYLFHSALAHKTIYTYLLLRYIS